MNEFWSFAGNYWWLAFPILGMLGGFGRTWERNARRRHERRLEVMRAKAELKAAAHGQALPAASYAATIGSVPTSASPATDGTADPAQTSPLGRLFDAHDAVTARWLEYELDIAKLIAFPAMSDGRQPLTAAFLRAKKVADGLRPASLKAKVSREQLTDYRNAVTDFEVAFDVAERDARRIRDSSFTAGERKRLDTAKQLLTVAIDQAATPAERQLAYRRVREELDGLLSISDEAIEVLESKVALELTTGAHPRATAETAPTETPAGRTGTDAAAPAPATHPLTVADPSLRPVREPKAGPWPVPERPSTGTGRVIHPKPQR